MNTRYHAVASKDGQIDILQTVQQPDGSWPSVDDCLAKWTPARRDRVAGHRQIEPAEIPTDRTFRDAWADKGRVQVDMPKAREIHRERMREARSPLLSNLDIEYQRADEAGDQTAKAEVAMRKQRLRDVTALPEIDAAKTPEQLKACWPHYLKTAS
jgi:hypothetical protein